MAKPYNDSVAVRKSSPHIRIERVARALLT
jgi:hypothetical protein